MAQHGNGGRLHGFGISRRKKDRQHIAKIAERVGAGAHQPDGFDAQSSRGLSVQGQLERIVVKRLELALRVRRL